MSKQSTKIAIAQSLHGLMCEKPFEKISVDSICGNAYVSRRNFYRHFPDKYALLNWFYFETYFSKITAREDWVMWDYLLPMCQQFYEDKAFFKSALQVTGQNSLRAYCLELLYPLAAKDMKGAFAAEKLFKIYCLGIMEAIIDYILDWLRSDPGTPPVKFADNLRRAIAMYSKHIWEVASGGM